VGDRSDKELCHHFFSERAASCMFTDGISWTTVLFKRHSLNHRQLCDHRHGLNAFKNGLAKLRLKRMGFFMDFSLHSPLAGSSASLVQPHPAYDHADICQLLEYPKFNCFDTIPACDGHTHADDMIYRATR